MLDSTMKANEYPIIHSEVKGLHPLVHQWLIENGYSDIQHEIPIAKGRRVDFVAVSPDNQSVIVECKIGKRGSSRSSIAQLENYKSILKADKGILFVSQDAKDETALMECEQRGHDYRVADCYYQPAKASEVAVFEIPLINGDTRPFPLIVASFWDFPLVTAKHPENKGELVYCVNDWVSGFMNSGDTRKIVFSALSGADIKIWELRCLRRDGKRQYRRFTDTAGLFVLLFNLRSTEKYPRAKQARSHLAKMAAQFDVLRTATKPVQMKLIE